MFSRVLIGFADQPKETYISPKSGSSYCVPIIWIELGKHADLCLSHLLKSCQLALHGSWRSLDTLFAVFRDDGWHTQPLRHAGQSQPFFIIKHMSDMLRRRPCSKGRRWGNRQTLLRHLADCPHKS